MSKRVLVLFFVLLILVAACINVFPTYAASRTLVVPDDYVTLTDAVGNATAGDTVLVRAGVYEEQSLKIDKALTIIGQDQNGTIINFYPALLGRTELFASGWASFENAVVINVDGVVFSNFTINSNGGTIAVFANRTVIADNKINRSMDCTSIAVNGHYNNITGNHIGNYHGLTVAGTFNVIAGNYAKSVSVQYNSNVIYNNTLGTLILGSSNFSCVSKNMFPPSPIVYSTGISLINCYNNDIYANYVANHTFPFSVWQSENNTFYHNNFVNNLYLVKDYDWFSTFPNFLDNGFEGNFWSGYNGSDVNCDGLGDTPYVLDENLTDNHPLIYPYDIENDVVRASTSPFLFVAIVGVVAVVGVGLFLVYLRFYRKNQSRLTNLL
ncbi:MAG: hypothetical protein IAX22_08905 [Candidatus Bathyarchaeota archaeon]|nr:hypothetical protein [Candidatus Bathyarchaeota archaeon]